MPAHTRPRGLSSPAADRDAPVADPGRASFWSARRRGETLAAGSPGVHVLAGPWGGSRPGQATAGPRARPAVLFRRRNSNSNRLRLGGHPDQPPQLLVRWGQQGHSGAPQHGPAPWSPAVAVARRSNVLHCIILVSFYFSSIYCRVLVVSTISLCTVAWRCPMWIIWVWSIGLLIPAGPLSQHMPAPCDGHLERKDWGEVFFFFFCLAVTATENTDGW
jgi:hypothetical protein